jgi:hypothetical protein
MLGVGFIHFRKKRGFGVYNALLLYQGEKKKITDVSNTPQEIKYINPVDTSITFCDSIITTFWDPFFFFKASSRCIIPEEFTGYVSWLDDRTKHYFHPFHYWTWCFSFSRNAEVPRFYFRGFFPLCTKRFIPNAVSPKNSWILSNKAQWGERLMTKRNQSFGSRDVRLPINLLEQRLWGLHA